MALCECPGRIVDRVDDELWCIKCGRIIEMAKNNEKENAALAADYDFTPAPTSRMGVRVRKFLEVLSAHRGKEVLLSEVVHEAGYKDPDRQDYGLILATLNTVGMVELLEATPTAAPLPGYRATKARAVKWTGGTIATPDDDSEDE